MKRLKHCKKINLMQIYYFRQNPIFSKYCCINNMLHFGLVEKYLKFLRDDQEIKTTT